MKIKWVWITVISEGCNWRRDSMYNHRLKLSPSKHDMNSWQGKYKNSSSQKTFRIYGLLLKRRNSIANVMELRLFCIKSLLSHPPGWAMGVFYEYFEGKTILSCMVFLRWNIAKAHLQFSMAGLLSSRTRLSLLLRPSVQWYPVWYSSVAYITSAATQHCSGHPPSLFCNSVGIAIQPSSEHWEATSSISSSFNCTNFSCARGDWCTGIVISRATLSHWTCFLFLVPSQ